MTSTRPRRLITLHLSHMGLTLGLTFMSRFLSLVLYPLFDRADPRPCCLGPCKSETQHLSTPVLRTSARALCLPTRSLNERPVASGAGPDLVGSLVPVGDPAPRQIVRSYLYLNSVSREDANPVHPHLARAVREYLVTVFQLYPEHGIGQWLDHLPFQDYRVFTWFSQVTLLKLLVGSCFCRLVAIALRQSTWSLGKQCQRTSVLPRNRTSPRADHRARMANRTNYNRRAPITIARLEQLREQLGRQRTITALSKQLEPQIVATPRVEEVIS
jgi:hypothetical protein